MIKKLYYSDRALQFCLKPLCTAIASKTQFITILYLAYWNFTGYDLVCNETLTAMNSFTQDTWLPEMDG